MNININQLFKCNAYLGENKRNWNSNMNLFIIGHKYDIYFMNLKYTLFLFKKLLKLFAANSKINILMLVPEEISLILRFSKKRKIKFIKNCNNINIVKRWVFGILSNYNVFKKNYGLKFPKILFLFPNISDNSKYVTLLNEVRKYNIVSTGFINTADNPYLLDYFIPINNNSTELIKLYFRSILVYIYTLNLKSKYRFFKRIAKRVAKRAKFLKLFKKRKKKWTKG